MNSLIRQTDTHHLAILTPSNQPVPETETNEISVTKLFPHLTQRQIAGERSVGSLASSLGCLDVKWVPELATHTHIYIHTYIHTYTHKYKYVRTYIHTYINAYIRTRMRRVKDGLLIANTVQ